MSAAGLSVGVEPEAAPRTRRLSFGMIMIGLAGLIVLLSLVRLITGADDLTSAGQVGAALALAVPIGLAGLGGLWSERAGVVNIGLEGMMILGTWFGAWAGYQWGPWWGVLAGMLGGALGGLLHGVATVTFGVDHIVSGVAINILALGIARYLSSLVFVGKPGGGVIQSPRVRPVQTVTVPGLSDWLSSVEKHHWFLVSDVAGISGGLVTDVSLLTILAVLLIPFSFFVLWRTSFGLRLRSCGENPWAAESLGVNVYRFKYAAVAASGAFAGLGGVFLVVVASAIYREGQTGGRGYIGLAAMIFGNWRPAGLAAGAGLFGFTDALQLRRGGESVHALLVLLAILLIGLAVWHVTRGRRRAAVISLAVAGVLIIWYASTDTVPEQFTSFAPHLTTLLVLSLAAQRLRMPAADGLPYRRGMGE